MKKKDLPNTSWKMGLALFLGSLIIIVSVFLPWMSINFAWSFSKYNQGSINYKVNGVGLGTLSLNITYTNQSYDYSIMKNIDFFLPSFLPLGGLVTGIAIVNIIFSLCFINKRPWFLPRKIQEWVQRNSLELLILNSISLLFPLFLFSMNYFKYDIYSPLSQVEEAGLGSFPSYFSSTFPSLYSFYKSFFSYFNWIKSSNQYEFASNFKRHFMPGIGFFLVWIGGLILIYSWFIRLMITEKWPKVWQKRAFLIPFMITLAFLPNKLIITPHRASLTPLLLSNLFSGYAGGIYFLLTLSLLFLSRKAALIERSITQKIGDLLHEKDIKKEEASNITTFLKRKRKYVKYLRIAVGTLNVVLLLFVWILFYFLINLYIDLGITEETLSFFRHTFWNWPLFFSPLISLLINLIFVHERNR